MVRGTFALMYPPLLRLLALARPLRGRNRVARALLNWVRIGARIPGSSIRPAEVNGTPGALLLDGEGRLAAVWSLEMSGGQIVGLNSIVNPDKLGHLGPVSDAARLPEKELARDG